MPQLSPSNAGLRHAAGTLVPVATKPKKTASYDLKAADRRRNLLIQIGLTAIVVVFAVALVLYIVMSGDKKPAAGEAKAIRVASSKLITKEGTTEPKAVLSLYEDFLCPVCGRFEQQFGPTISQLIDSGADRRRLQHGRDPGPTGEPELLVAGRRRRRTAWPTRTRPRTRRRSGVSTPRCTPSSPARAGPVPHRRAADRDRPPGRVGGKVPDCINSGRYIDMVKGLAAATNVNATPTVRINGEDYQYSHARCAGGQDQGDRR